MSTSREQLLREWQMRRSVGGSQPGLGSKSLNGSQATSTVIKRDGAPPKCPAKPAPEAQLRSVARPVIHPPVHAWRAGASEMLTPLRRFEEAASGAHAAPQPNFGPDVCSRWPHGVCLRQIRLQVGGAPALTITAGERTLSLTNAACTPSLSARDSQLANKSIVKASLWRRPLIRSAGDPSCAEGAHFGAPRQERPWAGRVCPSCGEGARCDSCQGAKACLAYPMQYTGVMGSLDPQGS
eukprot:scaffold6362_cov378-Prasinococcus_capsulatus_cf.AAC.20